MGKPKSTDCLTLNVTSGLWERGTFANGLVGDGVRGMISLEGQGIFAIHSTGLSVLAPGSDTWEAGPMFPTPVECGCNVSSKSFVTIHLDDTHNVRQYSVANGRARPEPKDSWPNLLTKRYGPGCGASSYHLVVAGGVSASDEVLTSVEVFHIETKALKRGGNLQQARSYFQVIPLGSMHSRLLAVGGTNGTSTVDTSEWWEEEEDSWEEGPPLTTGRSNFAALMTMPQLLCFDIDPSAHSCTVEEDTEQTCTFSTHEQGMQIIGVSKRIFTDILGGRICFANFGYLLHSAMFSSLLGF